MSDFRDYLEKQLQNPEFKEEWQNLEPEYNMMHALEEARKECNLTQKDLAERTGINQADISKLETGNGNPTLAVLKRLADGMGMVLKLEFVPKAKL